MKWLLIKMLKRRIKKAIIEQIILKETGKTIVAKAYGPMIKNYEDTIMFLEAQNK